MKFQKKNALFLHKNWFYFENFSKFNLNILQNMDKFQKLKSTCFLLIARV